MKSAGKTKVVVAGGVKKGEKQLLKQVEEIMQAGCIGLAIGRNVWQNKNPLEITKKLRGLFGNENLDKRRIDWNRGRLLPLSLSYVRILIFLWCSNYL